MRRGAECHAESFSPPCRFTIREREKVVISLAFFDPRTQTTDTFRIIYEMTESLARSYLQNPSPDCS